MKSTQKITKTRVTCIQCPKCKEIIYSRYNHDFRNCSCGEVGIDAGFSSYGSRVMFTKKSPKLFFKYVNASREELYNDWNERVDKFGKI